MVAEGGDTGAQPVAAPLGVPSVFFKRGASVLFCCIAMN